MCKDVQPDDITFVSLLPACSHAGLVDEGMHCYASMITCYMICAKLEHYICMLNLLVCVGHLQESENMINRMPCKPHVMPWMSLLRTYKIHGHVEMGEGVAKWIFELEAENAAGMCFYQKSMLLLATHISLRMLNNRERKRCEETAG